MSALRVCLRSAIVAALAFSAAGAAAQPVAKALFLAEGSFALPTSGPGALERPRAIAWAAPDQIHIGDERGTVVVLDAAGAFVRSYGAGTLRRVAALAVDADGLAYVLDPEQRMVVVFDAAGEVVHRIGRRGNTAGELDDPVDLALGPTGLVYVLDKGRRGVQLFSVDGTFVHDLGLAETVEDARALGVTPAGMVFVADGKLPGSLLRLPELTTALATVDAPADAVIMEIRAGRVEEPVAVVTTPTGAVVSADRKTGVLWAIDGSGGGAAVGSDDRLYGGSGSGRGSFRRLEDAAIAGADQLVMLDSEGRKVERVRLVIEEGRTAERPMDYPVQFESVESSLEGGVLATAPRRGGTSWFALADAEGRNLRVVEARMVEARGVFDTPVRRPQPVGAPHAFGQLVERAGHVAMNDTLLVVTEPRRNRFHVFDLRSDVQIGTFGDGYSDSRRLRSPRGVALFADGRIAVADHDNDRIAVFSADLATLLGTFPLLKAEGVTISADGRLFAWDEDGVQVGEFPLAGGAFEPLGNALSAGGVAAVSADVAGNVYVLRRRSARVAVLNAGMNRLLARMGPQRGLENGDHVAVDVDGNVYATDLGKATTVVLRWGVDVAPVANVAARWEPTFADLSWAAVPGTFVTGYQVEGAPEEGGPWSRVTAATEPTARVQDPALRFYRVAPRTLTGGVGLPSPVVPALHLAANAAFAARDWERTRTLAREALATLAASGVEATAAAVQALNWAGFVAAHEAGDWEDAVAWQRLVGTEPPSGKSFEHMFRLADAHQRLGDVQAAVTRALAGLAIAAREAATSAAQAAALRQMVFDDSWDLAELAQVAATGEEMLRADAARARDAAFIERLARAQLETGNPQRALALLQPFVAADPAATPRRLLVITFMAAAALEDYERASELATAVGTSLDADQFVPFQGTLARVRLQTGDLPGARRELVALLVDPRDNRALADPAVARALLMVHASHVETGDPAGGRALVDSMVAALPPELADLRSTVLQRADSAAAVADTRAKLSEGFQFYRDALFRDALRFFQAADARTDLDVDQRLIVKELLAGTLYSLAQVETADETFRGVYAIDTQFNLVEHLEGVNERYGLSVFTEDMLTHFLGVAPLL